MTAPAPPAPKPRGPDAGAPATRFRWVLIGLLAVVLFVNFVDRTSIAFAVPMIRTELGLSGSEIGWILGLFGLGYFLSNPLCGWLIDRYGTRTLLTATLLLWAAAMVATGLAAGALVLAGARLLLGLAEGGSFPAISGVVRAWLPPKHRALAVSFTVVAVPLSICLAGPMMSLVIGAAGWRSAFGLLAAASALLAPFWWWLYRDSPAQSRFVNAQEAALIRAGEAPSPAPPAQPVSAVLPTIIANRTLAANNWAIFAASFFLFYFLTWLPSFLMSQHGLNLRAVGGFSFFAWGLGAVAMLLSGFLSDRILKARARLRPARSLPIIAGFIGMAGFSLPLAFGGQTLWVIGLLTLSIASLMVVIPLLVAINGDVAGPHAAFAHGVFTAWLAAAAFLAPIVTGYIEQASGRHDAVFALMAALAASAAILLALIHRPDADRLAH